MLLDLESLDFEDRDFILFYLALTDREKGAFISRIEKAVAESHYRVQINSSGRVVKPDPLVRIK